MTVEAFDETSEDTLDAIGATTDGDSPPAVVSFATVGELRKILTDRRIELLRALVDTDGAAESITSLAEDLDRDYRTVHDDVTLLADYGLLFIVDEGRPGGRTSPPSGVISTWNSSGANRTKNQRQRERSERHHRLSVR